MAEDKTIRRKVWLTFSEELVAQPVVYTVGHKFEVVTNIRAASVSNEIGVMALDLTGPEEEIARAVEYMQEIGVVVEPIEKSIVEG